MKFTKHTEPEIYFIVRFLVAILFIVSLCGSLLSGYTEFKAFQQTLGNNNASIVAASIIELLYHAFAMSGAVLLVFYLTKRRKFFLIMSLISYLLLSVVFFVSQALSRQGKDYVVQDYVKAPESVELDDKQFVELEKAANNIFSSDSINAVLISDSNIGKLYQDISRLKINNTRYENHPSPQEWMSRQIKINKSTIKNKETEIRRLKKSLEAERERGVLVARLKRDSTVAAVSLALSSAITTTNDTNKSNQDAYSKELTQMKSNTDYAIYAGLAGAFLFHFVLFYGYYKSGKRIVFREDILEESESHLWLLKQGYRVRFHNWKANKINKKFSEELEMIRAKVTVKNNDKKGGLKIVKDDNEKTDEKLGETTESQYIANKTDSSKYVKILDKYKNIPTSEKNDILNDILGLDIRTVCNRISISKRRVKSSKKLGTKIRHDLRLKLLAVREKELLKEQKKTSLKAVK